MSRLLSSSVVFLPNTRGYFVLSHAKELDWFVVRALGDTGGGGDGQGDTTATQRGRKVPVS